MITGDTVRVDKKIEVNRDWLKAELGAGESFDVICHEMAFAGREAALFFVNGMVKDQILGLILRTLAALPRESLPPNPLEKLFKQYITHIQVETLDDLHQAVDNILVGGAVLVVDGLEQVLAIDARQYPGRNPDEPDLEKVGVLLTTKSFGLPYLWPLIPLDWRALQSVLLRAPVPVQNRRPRAIAKQDRDRQPAPALKPLPRRDRCRN